MVNGSSHNINGLFHCMSLFATDMYPLAICYWKMIDFFMKIMVIEWVLVVPEAIVVRYFSLFTYWKFPFTCQQVLKIC